MRTAALVLIALASTACSSSAEQDVPPPVQTPAHSARGNAPMPPPGAPTGRPAAPGEGAASAPPADEQIAKLQAAYDAKPSDPSTKSALVAALMDAGNYYMATEDVPRREKYKKALGLYRRVLAIDPENAGAKSGAETIEAIYKQMGMPVPEA